MVGAVTGAPARTYSIGFAAAGYDEMAYARIAAQRFATSHTEYYVTPEDVVAAIPVIARHTTSRSATPPRSRPILREACPRGRRGRDAGGRRRRRAVRRQPALCRSVHLLLYERLRSDCGDGSSSLRCPKRAAPGRGCAKLPSYVAQASVPLPARLQTYNSVVRFGPAEIFEPDFLADVDVERPQRIQDAQYRRAHASSTLNRMLALDSSSRWRTTI